MNKPKKIPMRRCVATGEQYPKKEMFRVVRTPEGKIEIDLVGKMNGRGAYVSKSVEAINLAQKKKILEKHLEIAIPEEIFIRLKELIGENK